MTDSPADQEAPPPSDPWKSFSGVMAATLLLEAIVLLLAIPVVHAVGGGLTAVSLSYLIGLATLLVLLSGLQRRPWAIWLDLAVQGLAIAGFAIYSGVGFIGVLFAGLWAMLAYFRSEVRRRQADQPSPQLPPD